MMPDKPALLPCPFCGEMPNTCLYGGDTGIQISCENLHCGVYPKSIGEIALALAAWNTRADRWIPVSERLPEVDVPVLVMGENCYNQPVTVVRKLTERGWYDENDDYLMSFVTHWMPLPALPKEV